MTTESTTKPLPVRPVSSQPDDFIAWMKKLGGEPPTDPVALGHFERWLRDLHDLMCRAVAQSRRLSNDLEDLCGESDPAKADDEKSKVPACVRRDRNYALIVGLATRVDEAGLPKKIQHALENAGHVYIYHVMQAANRRSFKVRGLGRKLLPQLDEGLKRLHPRIALGMPISDVLLDAVHVCIATQDRR